MADSKIEWTDRVWNPVRGCSLVSAGCTNCYAMRQAHRFSGERQPYEGLTRLRASGGPVWTGRARFVSPMLTDPLGWQKPRRVFVNSMSDLFHEDITDQQIAAVFGVMAACPQHTFQILTKRPARMREWFGNLPMSPRWELAGVADEATGGLVRAPGNEEWPLPNVWIGVSCEDQRAADERLPHLLQTPAAVRFVSAEPLLGPLVLGLLGTAPQEWRHGYCGIYSLLHWVIVGGESGPGARTCDLRWIQALVEECRDAEVPCFVKQLGSRPTGEWSGAPPTHRLTDLTVQPPRESIELSRTNGGVWQLRNNKGGDPSEWPEGLRVRQFPEEARHA